MFKVQDLPCEFMHICQAAWIWSVHMCCTEKTKEHENTSLGKNCCMMSVHWHHTEWERIPGCIALVIFSSNRTGYHPHSQHCWRVCAPFRADLNKTGKLTQSLLRCMNINVTSDRVEWQTGNIDSLWVLGRDKLFPFERTWCFSQYEHEWSTYSPRS